MEILSLLETAINYLQNTDNISCHLLKMFHTVVQPGLQKAAKIVVFIFNLLLFPTVKDFQNRLAVVRTAVSHRLRSSDLVTKFCETLWPSLLTS